MGVDATNCKCQCQLRHEESYRADQGLAKHGLRSQHLPLQIAVLSRDLAVYTLPLVAFPGRQWRGKAAWRPPGKQRLKYL